MCRHTPRDRGISSPLELVVHIDTSFYIYISIDKYTEISWEDLGLPSHELEIPAPPTRCQTCVESRGWATDI